MGDRSTYRNLYFQSGPSEWIEHARARASFRTEFGQGEALARTHSETFLFFPRLHARPFWSCKVPENYSAWLGFVSSALQVVHARSLLNNVVLQQPHVLSLN